MSDLPTALKFMYTKYARCAFLPSILKLPFDQNCLRWINKQISYFLSLNITKINLFSLPCTFFIPPKYTSIHLWQFNIFAVGFFFYFGECN